MYTPYSYLILLHVTGDSYLLEVSSSLSDMCLNCPPKDICLRSKVPTSKRSVLPYLQLLWQSGQGTGKLL